MLTVITEIHVLPHDLFIGSSLLSVFLLCQFQLGIENTQGIYVCHQMTTGLHTHPNPPYNGQDHSIDNQFAIHRPIISLLPNTGDEGLFVHIGQIINWCGAQLSRWWDRIWPIVCVGVSQDKVWCRIDVFRWHDHMGKIISFN